MTSVTNYVCGICYQGYQYLGLLTQHMNCHDQTGPLWCTRCFVPKTIILRIDHECSPCRLKSLQQTLGVNATLAIAGPSLPPTDAGPDAELGDLGIPLTELGLEPTLSRDLKDVMELLEGGGDTYVPMYSPGELQPGEGLPATVAPDTSSRSPTISPVTAAPPTVAVRIEGNQYGNPSLTGLNNSTPTCSATTAIPPTAANKKNEGAGNPNATGGDTSANAMTDISATINATPISTPTTTGKQRPQEAHPHPAGGQLIHVYNTTAAARAPTDERPVASRDPWGRWTIRGADISASTREDTPVTSTELGIPATLSVNWTNSVHNRAYTNTYLFVGKDGQTTISEINGVTRRLSVTNIGQLQPKDIRQEDTVVPRRGRGHGVIPSSDFPVRGQLRTLLTNTSTAAPVPRRPGRIYETAWGRAHTGPNPYSQQTATTTVAEPVEQRPRLPTKTARKTIQLRLFLRPQQGRRGHQPQQNCSFNNSPPW